MNQPTTPPRSPASEKAECSVQNEHKCKPQDIYYYPPEIANDLQGVNLPDEIKAECFACAWEYTRCVIPQYTNWTRYVAFMRTIIIGIIAEFKGHMVDVSAGDEILGYNLQDVLDGLFKGTVGHELMCREYRSFLLITSEKTSEKRSGELFRRYVNSLAQSPRHWFRMRDCDALARFTVVSAMVCNDLDDAWFTDDQFEILTELGDVLYDAVAFYKHRSEGETNSTFAYMPPDLRLKAFHEARELLWALDVAWRRRDYHASVTNFIRFFGGPIHMMMRRYRFVEENLTIGKPEDENVVNQNRENFKLWNRVDARVQAQARIHRDEILRYRALLARSDELMFPELADFLETGGEGVCDKCLYRDSYGAQRTFQFGGVQLCDDCKAVWIRWCESLPARVAKAFPEVLDAPGHLGRGPTSKVKDLATSGYDYCIAA
ncbi:Molybdenum cofactor sulfurase [Gnomoniopsis smithogilvyi]|uniref:Molybdenum cofactor sulfurase n=1 Tax=Gnomoniopsis smithogilvyi TaxID=1191159 RepID=A0A9W8YIN3_9PEZI|nr:Molybdenum cofactor sulfurase [Gnomoniopsis smithogilvyi]